MTEIPRMLLELPAKVKRRWAGLAPETRLVFLGMALFTVVVTILSYLRHATFQTNAWDLGIYTQALWTTAFKGQFFYYTAELSWNASGSLFGVHSVPILFLIVPFMRIFPSALTLFLIQSGVVAASAVPLYLLMLRRTSRRLATILVLAYLASPPLLGAVFYDFHVEAFVPVMALTAWWAWEVRRYKTALVASLGLLAVIEFAAVILGAISLRFLLLGLLRWRRARHGLRPFPFREQLLLPLAVLVASAAAMFLLFAIPKVVSPSTPPLVQVGPLGNSIPQILVNLLNPSLVAQALAVNGSMKVAYVLAMVLAGGIVWILKPLDALPALPWALVALLTAAPLYASPAGNQYTFMVIPFLFPATASAITFLRLLVRTTSGKRGTEGRPPPAVARRRPGAQRILQMVKGREVIVFVAVALFASQVSLSPLSPYGASWLGLGRLPGEHEQGVNRLLALIPSQASVSAQPNLFPHVADRAEAYPYFVLGVDYVLADVTNGWFNGPLPAPTPPVSLMRQLRENATGEYGLLASADGAILLQKGYSGPPVVFAPLLVPRAPDTFRPQNATFFRDASSPKGSYLLTWANRTNAPMWKAPDIVLPLGEFDVQLLVRTGNVSNGTIRVTLTLDSTTVLGLWDLVADMLPSSWTRLTLRIVLPHPGILRVAADSLQFGAAIRFGGLDVTQLPTAAVLR